MRNLLNISFTLLLPIISGYPQSFDLEKDLKQQIIIKSEEVVDKGVELIGTFNINKFIKESKKRRFIVFNIGVPIGSQGNRFNAYHSTNSKNIYITTETFQEIIDYSGDLIQNEHSNINQKIFPYTCVLGVHEILGSMGYDDENYSMSLYWCDGITNDDKQSFFNSNDLLNQEFFNKGPIYKKGKKYNILDIDTTDSKIHFSTGGSTGVGGGGDIFSIMLKVQLLRKAKDILDENIAKYYKNTVYKSQVESIHNDQLLVDLKGHENYITEIWFTTKILKSKNTREQLLEYLYNEFLAIAKYRARNGD